MRFAYHIITTSLLNGTAFLSVLFFLILWFRKEERVHRTFNMAFLISLSAIVLFIIASIITGSILWDWSAILNSALLKNKLTIICILVLSWGSLLFLHLKFGKKIWRDRALSHLSLFLISVGFLTNIIASSIGGEVAGNGSGFEKIISLFGIETRYTFYLPTYLLIILWCFIGGVLLIETVARRKSE